jgi:hypothetical protein
MIIYSWIPELEPVLVLVMTVVVVVVVVVVAARNTSAYESR